MSFQVRIDPFVNSKAEKIALPDTGWRVDSLEPFHLDHSQSGVRSP